MPISSQYYQKFIWIKNDAVDSTHCQGIVQKLGMVSKN